MIRYDSDNTFDWKVIDYYAYKMLFTAWDNKRNAKTQLNCKSEANTASASGFKNYKYKI